MLLPPTHMPTPIRPHASKHADPLAACVSDLLAVPLRTSVNSNPQLRDPQQKQSLWQHATPAKWYSLYGAYSGTLASHRKQRHSSTKIMMAALQWAMRKNPRLERTISISNILLSANGLSATYSYLIASTLPSTWPITSRKPCLPYSFIAMPIFS